MKIKLLTAHGYLSFQPDGRIEYRKQASIWEEIDVVGLEALRSIGPGPDGGTSPAEGASDPLLGCSTMLRGLDLVRCLHGRIQPAGSLDKAFEVTKRVAWALRGEGAGLLLKPSGENIISWKASWFSAARVCWPDGRIVKVLTDVPTTNGPTWADDGSVDRARWVPAIDPRS